MIIGGLLKVVVRFSPCHRFTKKILKEILLAPVSFQIHKANSSFKSSPVTLDLSKQCVNVDSVMLLHFDKAQKYPVVECRPLSYFLQCLHLQQLPSALVTQETTLFLVLAAQYPFPLTIATIKITAITKSQNTIRFFFLLFIAVSVFTYSVFIIAANVSAFPSAILTLINIFSCLRHELSSNCLLMTAMLTAYRRKTGCQYATILYGSFR